MNMEITRSKIPIGSLRNPKVAAMLVECNGSEQSLFWPFFHYWAASIFFLRNEHHEDPLQRQPFNLFVSIGWMSAYVRCLHRMVCAMCSSNIAKELDKAAVEHEALVREVEIDAQHEVANTPVAKAK